MLELFIGWALALVSTLTIVLGCIHAAHSNRTDYHSYTEYGTKENQ